MPAKMPNNHANKNIARNMPSVYRPGSSYDSIHRLLMAHGSITKDALLKKAMAVTHKPESLCRFSISIVTSIRKQDDGTFTFHSSAAKGVDHYYCEVFSGGLIKLHLRASNTESGGLKGVQHEQKL
jgi:hypothetical protein